MLSSSEILILGACVRPCATIAAAAGYQVTAIDLFNDLDTRAASKSSIKADQYPDQLFRIAESSKTNYWLYAGSLENYPEQIAQLASKKTLLGNNQDVIHKCRSPEFICKVAQDASWNYPGSELTNTGYINSGPPIWLSKPRLSAAGQGVQVSRTKPPANPDRLVQLFIPGPTYGAACISNGSETQILGVTRHLRMSRRLGTARFQYCGSVGPMLVAEPLNTAISTMANEIALRCSIVGLFGLDFKVWDNQLWLLEINPRFTASMDLLSNGADTNIIQQHIDACHNKPLTQMPNSHRFETIKTRAILFAKSPTRFISSCNTLDYLADIPDNNALINVGNPICSVYGRGKTASESVKHAMENAHHLETTMTVDVVK
ncbi:MAG: ATP-grasp domain-containing protein [Pirellulaceae bacterium]